MKDADKPLVTAKIGELAARAEAAKIKLEQNKFWPGELANELASFQNIVRELQTLVGQRGGDR